MSRIRDDIFVQRAYADGFRFDARVASVFDDMAERSIPFYRATQRMAAALAAAFARPGTTVLDLGCSTATTLCRLADAIPDPSIRLVGMDRSPAMLELARKKLRRHGLARRVQLIEREIAPGIDVAGSSVVLMNWTLQFIPPRHRGPLLRSLCAGLDPRGCLVLCEKVAIADPRISRLFIHSYHQFKRQSGYSDSEIEHKRRSLENTLIPLSAERNAALLRRSGFRRVETFFRWFNFVGILAVK